MRATLLAPALFGLAHAVPMTFNVISFSQATSVNIGGTDHPLTAADSVLWTGSVETGTATTYRYTADGVTEAFDRAINASLTTTHYELVNRTQTTVTLPPFPQPIATNPQWTREAAKLPLYDDSYIPTIHITADPTDVTEMEQTLTHVVPSTFTIYLKDQSLVVPNANFSFHKVNPTYQVKRGLQVALPGQGAFGRNFFKLRDLDEDETKVRQFLYTDLAHAVGMTPPRERPVRVYVNREKYGLYSLNDFGAEIANVTSLENWSVNHFFNGVVPANMNIGELWDGGSGATWQYTGDSPAAYAGYVSDVPTQTVADLIPKFKLVAALGNDTTDANAAALAAAVDVDQLFRMCALEFLASSWDAFWMGNTNYIIFNDPVSNKAILQPQDFDETFGTPSTDVMTSSYQTWENTTVAPLINNLLKVPSYRTQFESYIVDIVKHVYNPVAFNRRAVPFFEQMYPEIEWDFTVTYKAAGKPLTGSAASARQAFYDNSTASGGPLYWVDGKAAVVAKQFDFTWDAVVQEPPADSTATTSGPAPTSTDTGSSAAPGTAVRGPAKSGARIVEGGVVGLVAAALAAGVLML
ncbi:hypothetical protein HKX48_007565 [Thoreauomyces humboldtii]|nr:hypothetical protein HKX48_007565 [Thoreauomyces humboldtii]